ncbi:MAG TPA: hypothetical protein VFT12_02105 [Thermoanaerobaculia bacterium]|nr:hypothetical protein [Thermoanaerobaculia bacterium]
MTVQLGDPVRLRTGRDPIAAGPELALAATCLVALFVPGLAARMLPTLGQTLALELAAIHSFPFLAQIAFARVTRPWARAVRFVVFLVIAGVYSWAASVFGTRAVVSFWTLALTTYFGALVHDAPEQRKQLLYTRWIVTFIVYAAVFAVLVPAMNILGMQGPRRGALICFVLFSIYGLLDLTNAYDRILLRQSRAARAGDDGRGSRGVVRPIVFSHVTQSAGLLATAAAFTAVPSSIALLIKTGTASPAWWVPLPFAALGVFMMVGSGFRIAAAIRHPRATLIIDGHPVLGGSLRAQLVYDNVPPGPIRASFQCAGPPTSGGRKRVLWSETKEVPQETVSASAIPIDFEIPRDGVQPAARDRGYEWQLRVTIGMPDDSVSYESHFAIPVA